MVIWCPHLIYEHVKGSSGLTICSYIRHNLFESDTSRHGTGYLKTRNHHSLENEAKGFRFMVCGLWFSIKMLKLNCNEMATADIGCY